MVEEEWQALKAIQKIRGAGRSWLMCSFGNGREFTSPNPAFEAYDDVVQTVSIAGFPQGRVLLRCWEIGVQTGRPEFRGHVHGVPETGRA